MWEAGWTELKVRHICLYSLVQQHLCVPYQSISIQYEQQLCRASCVKSVSVNYSLGPSSRGAQVNKLRQHSCICFTQTNPAKPIVSPQCCPLPCCCDTLSHILHEPIQIGTNILQLRSQTKLSQTQKCIIVYPGPTEKTSQANSKNQTLSKTYSSPSLESTVWVLLKPRHEGITSLQKLIFNLSACHLEHLSELDAKHALNLVKLC